MKLVYVSRSPSGAINPFVKEQAEAVGKNFKVEIRHFLIRKGGFLGYANAIISFNKFLKSNKVDIVHVHYGLWSLVAIVNNVFSVKKYKVVVTYHGSDINKKNERRISLLGARFSSHNILVSDKMAGFFHKNYSILPCGINTDVILGSRERTRAERVWGESDFVILFSSSFDRVVKDPGFAFSVIETFSSQAQLKIRFLEMKGYTREEVTGLMQAADVLLMCSQTEGSPQVIKEAILNGLPVISNDVGDVKAICEGVDNCFIIEKDMNQYVACLKLISQRRERIQNRRPIIEKFDNNKVSKQLYEIYQELV
jgi:glycosyltransferase involved in cell wall biosynthesis